MATASTVASFVAPTNSAPNCVMLFWMDMFMNSKSEQAHFKILLIKNSVSFYIQELEH
jgi:hypothetical protein